MTEAAIQEIRLKLLDVLRADTTLQTLMGGTAADSRIYPYYRGQASITPAHPGFITYSMVARTEAVYAVDSPVFSFAVWSLSEGRCSEITTRLETILNKELFVTSGNDRIYVKLANDEDAFSEQPDYSGRRLTYRVGVSTC